MSLTEEFLAYRNKAAERWEAKGYWEAEEILGNFNLTLEDLHKSGFLRLKAEVNTDDITPYEPTSKGKKYIKYLKEAQLFLIKGEDVGQLQAIMGF